MATAAVSPMTTSTESWGRRTSAVCRPEGVQARHDRDLWPLSWPFIPCPSVPTRLARWLLLEGLKWHTWVRGRGMMCGEVYRLWPQRLIPTSPCTICQDHKHIRLSMAQPLWFSVQYWYVCVCVCVRAPCALYKGISFSLHACIDAWTFSLVLIARKVWWSKVLASLNKTKHFTQWLLSLFTLDWGRQSHVCICEVGVVTPFTKEVNGGQWIHSKAALVKQSRKIRFKAMFVYSNQSGQVCSYFHYLNESVMFWCGRSAGSR